jgi:hypothetical protein
MPLRAARVRSAIWAGAPLPNRLWNLVTPSGRNSHDSVTCVPPSTGVKVKPHRTHEPPTTKANSRPRSAATT